MNERQRDELVGAITGLVAVVVGMPDSYLQPARDRLASALDACFRDDVKQDNRTAFKDIEQGRRFRWIDDADGAVYMRIRDNYPGVKANTVILISSEPEDVGKLYYFPGEAGVYPF